MTLKSILIGWAIAVAFLTLLGTQGTPQGKSSVSLDPSASSIAGQKRES